MFGKERIWKHVKISKRGNLLEIGFKCRTFRVNTIFFNVALDKLNNAFECI